MYKMVYLSLTELLGFLQHDPSTYRTPVVFGEADPKIMEMIMEVFSAYKKKIHCLNPYLEVPRSLKSITLQKSQEARFSFPALSVGIIGTTGLNFNNYSPNTEGWPGSSTAQVVANFPGKLHLLAELHGAKEVDYYSGFAYTLYNPVKDIHAYSLVFVLSMLVVSTYCLHTQLNIKYWVHLYFFCLFSVPLIYQLCYD